MEVTHPYFTKTGVVYVCDDEHGAFAWADYNYRPVVLCVDVEVHSFDRNFPNDGEWGTGDGIWDGPAAYEVIGPVSPDRIRVHIDGQCIALSEYVGRN